MPGERRTFCPEDGHACYTPAGPEPQGFECANYGLCKSFEPRPPQPIGERMMQAKYLRDDFDAVLAHAVEECGEFLSAAGKTQRWGRKSFNPELPEQERETNEAWLRREMADVRLALARLEMALDGGLSRKLDREVA